MARAIPLKPIIAVILPSVSVIVPAYNAAATIDACITSLLRLDYPRDRVEIVVVDNASTDDTPQILARFGDQVRVLRERTRGPAAARNCGLRSATHALVAMTDADCVVDPQWLRNLVVPLQDTAIAIVGGRILSVQPSNGIERFGEVIHDHEAAITHFAPPYVITMNWASRRAHLETCGYFDEQFLRAEDVELSYRFLRAGLRFAYAADAIVFHHNERTIVGLFREGFGHGMHSRHIAAKHGDWLHAQNVGARPTNPLRALRRASQELMQGDPTKQSLYRAVFGIGKELGKIVAAIA